MKLSIKKIVAILAATLLMIGCTNTTKQSTKLAVTASIYPLYDFAAKIGGDLIDLTLLTPAGIEPHEWEPSAKDIINLEQSDLVLLNGAGLEHWANDILPTLQNKDLLTVTTTEGIPLLEASHDHHDEEEHEEEDDHDHEGVDPHVWLNVQYAKQQLLAIKDAFVQKDPDHKTIYEANYERYAAEFDVLDQQYRETLATVTSKDLVVTHQAFSYLCEAYGLHQIAVEGLSAHSEPDPATMKSIVALMKEHQIRAIFYDDLVSSKVADTIAKETNATVKTLYTLESIRSEQLQANADYLSLMKQNLETLKTALQ